MTRDPRLELKNKHYQLPGRAGELILQGNQDALIIELGDKYDVYHAAFDKALLEMGGRPDPEEYEGDFERYGVDCARVGEILSAEVAARLAAAVRQGLSPAAAATAIYTGGLVDENHRLRSWRNSGAPEVAQHAPDWRPPPNLGPWQAGVER